MPVFRALIEIRRNLEKKESYKDDEFKIMKKLLEVRLNDEYPPYTLETQELVQVKPMVEKSIILDAHKLRTMLVKTTSPSGKITFLELMGIANDCIEEN